MKKLYSEQQYRKYSEFMDKIANTDDIIKGFHIHSDLTKWLKSENLLDIAIEQMDNRLEEEFIKETSDEPNKDFKVIDFPKNK